MRALVPALVLTLSLACSKETLTLDPPNPIDPEDPLPACSATPVEAEWHRVSRDVDELTIGPCGEVAFESNRTLSLLSYDLITTTELGASMIEPVFAPSGRSLAYAIGDKLHARTLRNGEEKITTLGGDVLELGFASSFAEALWTMSSDRKIVRAGADAVTIAEQANAMLWTERGSTVIYQDQLKLWLADIFSGRTELIAGLDPLINEDPQEMRKDNLRLTRDGRVFAHQTVWYAPCGDTFCRDRESTTLLVDLAQNRVVGEVDAAIASDDSGPSDIYESTAIDHVLLLGRPGFTDILDEELGVGSFGPYVPVHLYSDLERALVLEENRALLVDLSDRSELTIVEGRSIGTIYVSAGEETVVVPHLTDRCIRYPDNESCHTHIYAATIRHDGGAHFVFAMQPIEAKWADARGRAIVSGELLFEPIPERAERFFVSGQTCLFDERGERVRCWEDRVEQLLEVSGGRVAIVFQERDVGPHAMRLDLVRTDTGDSITLIEEAVGIEIHTDRSKTRLYARTQVRDFSIDDELWAGSFAF